MGDVKYLRDVRHVWFLAHGLSVGEDVLSQLTIGQLQRASQLVYEAGKALARLETQLDQLFNRRMR
jgi:hypothetical protein